LISLRFYRIGVELNSFKSIGSCGFTEEEEEALIHLVFSPLPGDPESNSRLDE